MKVSFKKVVGIAAVAGTLAVSGIALANAPTVSIDPIGPLEYATFPQVYNVTGTLTHTPNVQSISELKLFINGVQEGATQDPAGLGTSGTFSLPWNITAAGSYEVMVTAKHGGSTGDDSEEVVVTQTVLPPVVITECPAAPAVAVAYMQSKSVKSGSAYWKKVINAVAKQTGTGGSLFAGTACNAGYAEAVKAFVDSL
jgi:hypothetical protein